MYEETAGSCREFGCAPSEWRFELLLHRYRPQPSPSNLKHSKLLYPRISLAMIWMERFLSTGILLVSESFKCRVVCVI